MVNAIYIGLGVYAFLSLLVAYAFCRVAGQADARIEDASAFRQTNKRDWAIRSLFASRRSTLDSLDTEAKDRKGHHTHN